MVAFTLLVMFPYKMGLFITLSNYSVQIVFLFLLMGMIFLIIDTKRLLFTALGCSAVLCIFLKNNSNKNIILPIANIEGSINIAHINLTNSENDVEGVLDMIIRTDPDVLSLQEYTPFWKNVLQEHLKGRYDNLYELVRIDPHGIALASNMDVARLDTFYSRSIPGLNMITTIGTRQLEIISTYISPSLDRNSSELADDQLSTINGVIRKNEIPSIVLGEFNHVYWSNKIRTFRSENQLLNSRRNVPLTDFSVPVDHIFHTSDIECTSFKDLIDYQNRRLGIVGSYQFGRLPNEEEAPSYGFQLE